MKLTAFNLYPGDPLMPLEPADWRRNWMGETAQKCLPLRIAAEIGWVLRNPSRVEASWNGRAGIDDMRVSGSVFAASHFGEGILTFSIPYIFRTEPGWSLLVQGPINGDKTELVALSAIVETDKAVETFTMNWRFRHAGRVTFAAGEPICQVVPVPSNLGVDVEPVMRPIDDDPELKAGFEEWSHARDDLNERWHRGEATKRQGNYAKRIEHGRLKTKPFEQARMDGDG